jgi:hypothetical protein
MFIIEAGDREDLQQQPHTSFLVHQMKLLILATLAEPRPIHAGDGDHTVQQLRIMWNKQPRSLAPTSLRAKSKLSSR